ncbi:hypothetical protein BABINDRAFT_162816 [Babjeviella inositovora NRRL Y-12698]|uniref:Mif2/CENP-C cupin domain-containing protein n=1 Tax=Babjeviella inositovora NRRL Y-12698 TaxID=984486 RepID=A0A1E3QL06_9ASCO|nr:uncharacterized protein BABINDRAFT_162816 [Babjeviella inositovora NRRL Y-12698]ODQ78144.1 hypothetical protein BABINDRAFT_162816 [Babjeviella inositovora NRRL Y-12698]
MSELLNIGSQSRKTGLRAKPNTRRDEHDMEDLDDFFADEPSGKPHPKQLQNRFRQPPKQTSITSVARTLDFSKSNHLLPVSQSSSHTDLALVSKTSPLLSPLPSRRQLTRDPSSDDNYQDFDMGADNESQPMEIDSPEPRASTQQERSHKRLLQDLETLGDDSSEDSLFDDERLRSGSPRNRQSTSPEEVSQPVRGRNGRNQRSVEPSQPVRGGRRAKRPTIVESGDELENVAETEQEESDLVEVASKAKPWTRNNYTGHVRRSTRRRVEPLAYWRNEKIIYTANLKNGIHVQEIQDVIHMPSNLQKPRAKPGPKKRKTPVSVPRVRGVPAMEGARWYKAGQLAAEVFEGYGSDKKVQRTIAWAPNKEQYVSSVGDDNDTSAERFKLAILFDENRDFAASGILTIAAGSFKGLKCTDDTYMIFHVVQGVVEVEISQQTFVAGERCLFEVPMGNFYALRNVGSVDLKLFFVQTKYVVAEPADEWS